MEKPKKEIYHIGEEGFFPAWFSKLLFTLISVKFWGLVVSISVSTNLLLVGKIEGQQWVLFNTTIWGLIFGMKEVFRISSNKSKAEQALVTQQSQQKLDEMKLSTGTSASTPQMDAVGKEIVGDEPS